MQNKYKNSVQNKYKTVFRIGLFVYDKPVFIIILNADYLFN